MKVDVKTRCIITLDGGEQYTIENVSSIMVEIEFMGQKFSIFKPLDTLALDGRWR